MIAATLLSVLFAAPSCAGVSPRVLAGIVQQESGGEPLAIHDDTESRSYFPRDVASATSLITRLSAAHHAFSVGLMQIENTNWSTYRVTGPELLEPALNVAIGCSVYRENLAALRAYNTGSPRPSYRGDRYAEAVLRATILSQQVPGTSDGSRTLATAPRIHFRVAAKRSRKKHPTVLVAAKVSAFGFSAVDPATH